MINSLIFQFNLQTSYILLDSCNHLPSSEVQQSFQDIQNTVQKILHNEAFVNYIRNYTDLVQKRLILCFYRIAHLNKVQNSG